MTFGEVEFLDEPEPARHAAFGAGPGPAASSGPSALPLAVAVAGWLAAAAVAAWAPFHTFLAITIAAGSQTTRQSIDGWGRIATHASHTSGGTATTVRTTGHAARYGIAFCACAGLCVLATLLVVLLVRVRAARSDRAVPFGRVVAGLGVAAPCLLAGVIAPIALTAQAQYESYRELPAGLSGVHLDLGPCLWLSLAGLGCALLGSAGYLAWYLAVGRPRPVPNAASDVDPGWAAAGRADEAAAGS